MSRILKLILSLSVSLLPLLAGAKDGAHISPATIRWYNDISPWQQSSNAAGLASLWLPEYSTVNLIYNGQDGDYHRPQEGDFFSETAFDTEGSLGVGKTRLWGHFRYSNIAERGTRFNTVLFNPFDERQVFSVADPNVSDWKRQVYLMEFKAARPLSDALFAGIHVSYADRMAAKQVDPRSESYRYDLSVVPSFVWRNLPHSIGLSAEYSRSFERSVPTLSNVSEIQDVYLVRGLGNFVKDIVGSGGLSTIYYNIDTFGAALQYFLDRCEWGIMTEAGFRSHSTSTRESATQPFNMGSTRMNEAFATLRARFPRALAYGSFLYRQTDATEYTSVWNKTSGEWEVRTSALGSRYSTINADLGYDRYFGWRDNVPYEWKASAKLNWISKRDRYMLPEASFTYSNLSLSLLAEHLFGSGSIIWNVGAELLGNKNLGGEYNYKGIQPNEIPATVWYPLDSAIVCSDYVSAGGSAGLSLPLGGRFGGTSFNAGVFGKACFASENRSRLFFGVSAGLIF